MQVFDVMTRDFESLPENSSVLEAAKKMRDLNVGIIPIERNGNIEGIVTDRDITIRALAEELNPAKLSLGEIMTKEAFFCNTEDDVNRAAQLMEEKKVRRLLVKDKEGKFCGIVSLGDIATHVSKDLSGEILQYVSQPSHPNR
ncbi:CBS domain protein [Chitinispirillum alkaliphilum]|nr:CBS domain protein [Chitinispirillum alkaliphilum]